MDKGKILGIIDRLSTITLDGVFNPYRDNCPISDREDAVNIRRQNLSNYFDAVFKLQSSTAWVGEALGYRGGRRTGLPLSDTYLLDKIANHYQCQLQDPTVDQTGEATAKIVWAELVSIENYIFLWNCFPLHPHLPNHSFTNRKPRIRELDEVKSVQLEILDTFDFDKIYALGRSSEQELTRLGFDIEYIRHPSHGGANIFRETISEIYRI